MTNSPASARTSCDEEANVFGSCRSVKFGVAVLMVAATLAAASAPSYAATGSVRIIITRAAFVVSGGPFGAPRVDLFGRAYNMRTAASIHGTYSAAITSAASGSGAKVVRLQNWQGVVLELRGRGGVKPSVDLN